jgi:hypothetical protein
MEELPTFRPVGDLRALLEGVPDDRPLMAQVMGNEGGAWNMVPSFLALAPGGSIAVLTLWHPFLAQLPAMDGGASLTASPAASVSSSGTTVRVRIAVAVDANGNYSASGWKAHHDSAARAMLENALDCLEGDENTAWARHWVEADVPLPLPPQVIQGDVSPAEQERG